MYSYSTRCVAVFVFIYLVKNQVSKTIVTGKSNCFKKRVLTAMVGKITGVIIVSGHPGVPRAR